MSKESLPRIGECRNDNSHFQVWDGTQWMSIKPFIQLPDGSSFMTTSLSLPEDHWLYQTDESLNVPPPPIRLFEDTNDNEHTPLERKDARLRITKAVQWALKAATMNGTEQNYDPDAVVQNTVYALLGPNPLVSAKLEK